MTTTIGPLGKEPHARLEQSRQDALRELPKALSGRGDVVLRTLCVRLQIGPRARPERVAHR